MRIRIHWLFAALLLFAAGAGYQVEALILVGSLAAHEIAHLVVAWVLGLSMEEVLLTPLGGMARLDSSLERDPQAETSVALAGPFQSFFLAGAAQLLLVGELWDPHLVQFFFETNANLAFFNLIPALPMDGGRAIRGLLAQRWGYRRLSRWMNGSGWACGFAMATGALYALMHSGQFYAAPMAGGIFLMLGLGREVEEATFRSYRQFLAKRERLAGRRVMGAQHLVAVAGSRLREVLEHLAARQYHIVLVVDSNLQPLGTLYESELLAAFQTRGPEIPIEQILEL